MSKSKPYCECLNWARTDWSVNGYNSLHHQNCTHYDEKKEQVLCAMWDAKIKMLEVGEYLKAYEHGEWLRHSGEIIGAAKLLDSWIEGFKKEIMGIKI